MILGLWYILVSSLQLVVKGSSSKAECFTIDVFMNLSYKVCSSIDTSLQIFQGQKNLQQLEILKKFPFSLYIWALIYIKHIKTSTHNHTLPVQCKKEALPYCIQCL